MGFLSKEIGALGVYIYPLSLARARTRSLVYLFWFGGGIVGDGGASVFFFSAWSSGCI